MKNLAIIIFLIFIAAQSSFAQSTTVEQEITKLSKEKWQWMADKNVEVLNNLFHEKSMFVHMGGS